MTKITITIENDEHSTVTVGAPQPEGDYPKPCLVAVDGEPTAPSWSSGGLSIEVEPK